MTITVHVQYNTRTASRSLGSYRVDIVEGLDEELAPLTQSGPIYNDISSYRGVFRNRREAYAALDKLVAAPFSIVKETCGPETCYRVARVDAQSKNTPYGRIQVVYRSAVNRLGMSVA